MRNSKLASEIPPWKSVKYLLEASPPRQRYYLIIAIGFESISGAPIRKNGRLQKTRERFQIVTHPSPQFHNLVPASAPLPPLHDIEKIFHRPGSFEYFNLFRHFYRSIQEIVQAKEYECLFLKKKKLFLSIRIFSQLDRSLLKHFLSYYPIQARFQISSPFADDLVTIIPPYSRTD